MYCGTFKLHIVTYSHSLAAIMLSVVNKMSDLVKFSLSWYELKSTRRYNDIIKRKKAPSELHMCCLACSYGSTYIYVHESFTEMNTWDINRVHILKYSILNTRGDAML